MPNTGDESPRRSWTNNQNSYLPGAARNEPMVDTSFLQGEIYGMAGRYANRTTLSENYTVLPVGHGNFLKVYHSSDNEPPTFNSYELFSSSSIISPDTVLPHQNSFDNSSQLQNNETTNMIINQLVTNWSPNLTGTYSPFGENGGNNNFSINGENSNNSNSLPQPINKTVGVHNLRPTAKTNGSFENNSSKIPEVKKRIVAEVKPMRMSYSDVLSKNVALNSHNLAQANQNPNYLPSDANQLRNSKVLNEKGRGISQIVDRKNVDDKEKGDLKTRKDNPIAVKPGESIPVNFNGNQKDKKRNNVEDKESPLPTQNKQSKKSAEFSKCKKNVQPNNSCSKKKSKRDGENADVKVNSKGNDKEYFYNITKNENVGEKYQKAFQHGNLKKKQPNGGQRNNLRTEKIVYSKRIQKQKDVKYEMVVKFLEKWYEYTAKILIWLFYLIYDIIVLGFSMVVDWLQTFYGCMCIFFVNFRTDFKNNSGKPHAWVRNILRKLDGKFMENSKFAFWRSFYKRRQQEPVADFYKNGRLPQTGDEAMYSLLNCKGKDAYSILGVASDSSQEQIRKHYKKIAVLVHPDKNKQPGAEEAFKVLQRAFELIGEPENRKTYDQSLAEALNAEKAWTELHDLLSQLQSKIAEAANTIRCSSCGLRHPRKLTERPHYAARECSSCKISHSAREGDIWAETSVFGLRWKYFALMEGKVYDITEWANCQKGALSHLQPNSHIVQYRIVRGGQQNQQNPQPEKERSSNREEPSEPSLDDFLDNLYSGQNPANQQSTTRRRSKRN